MSSSVLMINENKFLSDCLNLTRARILANLKSIAAKEEDLSFFSQEISKLRRAGNMQAISIIAEERKVNEELSKLYKLQEKLTTEESCYKEELDGLTEATTSIVPRSALPNSSTASQRPTARPTTQPAARVLSPLVAAAQEEDATTGGSEDSPLVASNKRKSTSTLNLTDSKRAALKADGWKFYGHHYLGVTVRKGRKKGEVIAHKPPHGSDAAMYLVLYTDGCGDEMGAEALQEMIRAADDNTPAKKPKTETPRSSSSQSKPAVKARVASPVPAKKSSQNAKPKSEPVRPKSEAQKQTKPKPKSSQGPPQPPQQRQQVAVRPKPAAAPRPAVAVYKVPKTVVPYIPLSSFGPYVPTDAASDIRENRRTRLTSPSAVRHPYDAVDDKDLEIDGTPLNGRTKKWLVNNGWINDWGLKPHMPINKACGTVYVPPGGDYKLESVKNKDFFLTAVAARYFLFTIGGPQFDEDDDELPASTAADQVDEASPLESAD